MTDRRRMYISSVMATKPNGLSPDKRRKYNEAFKAASRMRGAVANPTSQHKKARVGESTRAFLCRCFAAPALREVLLHFFEEAFLVLARARREVIRVAQLLQQLTLLVAHVLGRPHIQVNELVATAVAV